MDVIVQHVPCARTVVEPTCGKGELLLAAAKRFPGAALVGMDIEPSYVQAARDSLRDSSELQIDVADFFALDWEQVLRGREGPIAVIGNPPWVTSATLGVLGSDNAPERTARGLSGLDARTGKSNFDVSESMMLRLLEVLSGRDATLAMLCKSAVARKVIERAAKYRLGLEPGGLWRIDARTHFDAAVDAVLFVAHLKEQASSEQACAWPVFASLAARKPERVLGLRSGVLLADAAAFDRTSHLVGTSVPEWRSGLKHDCARVMELRRAGADCWANGFGEVADVEADVVFPLLKGTDVAKGISPNRAVIVPQRHLGEDTSSLRHTAPRAWKYLSRYRDLLAARKSSIYSGKPEFAVFGIGPYSFAPWKVAISGLHKRAVFGVVGPHQGKPVVFDDTCYFLPFEGEHQARHAAEVLQSDLVADFFRARTFWDAKRPTTKALLQTLDLAALIRSFG